MSKVDLNLDRNKIKERKKVSKSFVGGRESNSFEKILMKAADRYLSFSVGRRAYRSAGRVC